MRGNPAQAKMKKRLIRSGFATDKSHHFIQGQSGMPLLLLALVAGIPADYSLIATDILTRGRGSCQEVLRKNGGLVGNAEKGRKKSYLSRVYKFGFYDMMMRIKIPHEDRMGL